MDLTTLVRKLDALSRTLDTPRVELWRVMLDANRREIKRLFRGSYIDRPRDSQHEPHSEGDTP